MASGEVTWREQPVRTDLASLRRWLGIPENRNVIPSAGQVDADAQNLFIPVAPSDTAPENAVISATTREATVLKYGFDYRHARGLIAKSQFAFMMKHHVIVFAYGEGVPVVSAALDDYYSRQDRGSHGRLRTARSVFER